MDINFLKRHILDNKKIEYILDEIGCHSISYHSNAGDNYYSCGNYNGDNKNAVVVYENEYLVCDNYTRDISTNNNKTSLIDLVMYNKSINLFEAIKYLCDILGLDYYYSEDDDLPESIKMTIFLYEMKKGEEDDDDGKINPISENILLYYKHYVNEMFYNDNVDYNTQKFFEVGYDDETNCITIPIRDEIGALVGVKGRYLDCELDRNKYVYLERCSKSRILYGLDKTLKYIKESGYVIVVESEKAVMQLWSMGFKNCVATSGKKVTKHQLNKIMALGVPILFCYDKDVSMDELSKIADKFVLGFDVYGLIDKENLLGEKESPTDNKEKFLCIIKNEGNIVKLK